MKTAPQQPKTRQQPEPVYHCTASVGGRLILDTAAGYRDAAACDRIAQKMLEAGYWQIVRTEAPK